MLVDFNTGKTQLVSFDQSNNTGADDVEMDGSVLAEKPSFRIFFMMLGLTFSSNWIGFLALSLLLELPLRKLEP